VTTAGWGARAIRRERAGPTVSLVPRRDASQRPGETTAGCHDGWCPSRRRLSFVPATHELRTSGRVVQRSAAWGRRRSLQARMPDAASARHPGNPVRPPRSGGTGGCRDVRAPRSHGVPRVPSDQGPCDDGDVLDGRRPAKRNGGPEPVEDAGGHPGRADGTGGHHADTSRCNMKVEAPGVLRAPRRRAGAEVP